MAREGAAAQLGALSPLLRAAHLCRNYPLCGRGEVEVPLVSLVAQWMGVRDAWDAETEKPGCGNSDTPECLRLEGIQRGLEKQIAVTPVTGADGAGALIRMAWIEGDAEHDQWPSMPRHMLAALKVWAEGVMA